MRIHPILPRPLAYVLLAVVAAVELGIFWLMLNPDVTPQYRAYYIDRTTTCHPQPVAGTYTLGETISFRSDGWEAAKPLKACGWLGPNGDGTPSKGHDSRVVLAVGEVTGPLRLDLELDAIDAPGPTSQRVEISANGKVLEHLTLRELEKRRVSATIPAGTVGEDGRLVIRFALPDAVSFEPPGLGSPTQTRAIRLIWLRVSGT